MPIVKKLTFAPFFIIFLLALLYNLSPFLKSYDQIFSLNSTVFIQLIIISSLTLLSSFFCILFLSLANDWKIVAPAIFIGSLTPFLLLSMPFSLFFAVGTLISQIIIFATLENNLKSYLNFSPIALFGPSIRHFSTLLMILICFIYFLSINEAISKNGFQIPDSLIDSAVNLASGLEQTDKPEAPAPKLSISKEQIELLRQNPNLLKQSGLDPSILETINKPQEPSQPKDLTKDLTKQLVKDQLDSVLKPYLNFIPAVLAVLLFLTLQSITSILNLLIYPLLWITFFILEKIGFVKFTTEMRPVKKMVI